MHLLFLIQLNLNIARESRFFCLFWKSMRPQVKQEFIISGRQSGPVAFIKSDLDVCVRGLCSSHWRIQQVDGGSFLDLQSHLF